MYVIWFVYVFRMVALTLGGSLVSFRRRRFVCFLCVFAPFLAHALAWEHLTTMVVTVQGPPRVLGYLVSFVA